MIDMRRPTPEEVHQLGWAVLVAMASAAGAGLVQWFFSEAQARLEGRRMAQKEGK